MRAALRFATIIVAVCLASLPVSASRDLTFDERVEAQEAIERIYYSHQTGATRPFDEAVPREALERKVRDYLQRSAALEQVWNRPVTAEALRREMERTARQTLMPNRLDELYEALGDDPFVVQECLARRTLVRRLTRNRFAFDERIHSESKRLAETLRSRLVAGDLDPWLDHPRRMEKELIRVEARARAPRGVGAVGELREDRTGFEVEVVLSEAADHLRVATYRFRKTNWDDWWTEVESDFDAAHVTAVADDTAPLPVTVAAGDGRSGQESLPPECQAGPDDIWDNGILDDMQETTGATAVWTGAEMIVWGGRAGDQGVGVLVNTGGRYDPLLDTWTLTSTVNAPNPSQTHTAVWTGTEMIIWSRATGGRYDPATDTWTPTSTVNVPTPTNHTAVWTGTEMIVWGWDSAGNVGTGGRYDPAQDVWTPTSTTGAPKRRVGHTAVWSGDEMIVWGGEDQFDPIMYDNGARYDPADDSWTATAIVPQTPSARAWHTAVWTGLEMIVWGGEGTSGSELSSGARYRPDLDEWSIISPERARTEHVAVWTGSEMLVMGGFNSWTGDRYDLAMNTWTEMSEVNDPPSYMSYDAVWTGTEMLTWGGGTGRRYDPAGDTWTRMTSPGGVEGRTNHAVVWTGTEMIVWGGQARSWEGQEYHLDTGGRYDPTLDAWTITTTVGAPPVPRADPEAVWTGAEMIVWGGRDANTGGRYDPIADAWTPVSAVGPVQGRAEFTAIWTGSEMIVWGGLGVGAPVGVNTGERYDPATDTWTPTSVVDAPEPRHAHTAIWTGSEMIVWGGYSALVGRFGDGARYDPVTDTWTPTSDVDAPVARTRHTAVWTGTEMIVWGGSGGSALDSGGEYNPVTDSWVATAEAGEIEARDQHTAVWTGAEMIVWGGGSYPERNGGRYDPVLRNWKETSFAGAPSERVDHTAVWTGDHMIVWGGYVDDTGFVTMFSGGRYQASLDTDDDGIINDCDCAPEDGTAFDWPSEIGNLLMYADKVGLEWDSDAASSGAGTTYDVMRGSAAELPVGSGPAETCVDQGSTATTSSDSEEPLEGESFYYLVRGANTCGHGTYGTNSLLQERVTTVCP